MTNQPGFTPGPWHLRQTTYDFDIAELNWHANRDHSTDPATDSIIKESEQAKRQLANAYLIRTAPELYEALAAIIDDFDYWYGLAGEWLPFDQRTSVTAARAVLAKARGSSDA